MSAVFVADGSRLRVDIERLAGLLRADQAVRPLVERIHRGDIGAAQMLLVDRDHIVEQFVDRHVFHEVAHEVIQTLQFVVAHVRIALFKGFMHHGPLLGEDRIHHQAHLVVNLHGVEKFQDIFARSGRVGGLRIDRVSNEGKEAEYYPQKSIHGQLLM